MATRTQVLNGLTGFGNSISKMGTMIMDRQQYDHKKALEDEEELRQKAGEKRTEGLYPAQLTTANAGAESATAKAGIDKISLSQALIDAAKRKKVDEWNQTVNAGNVDAGWPSNFDGKKVSDLTVQLNTRNAIREREGMNALTVAEFVKELANTDTEFGLKVDKTKAETEKTKSETGVGHYVAVPLGNNRLGAINTKTGKVNDTGESTEPKQSDLPIDKKSEVSALSTKNAGKISIANQIGSYLDQFKAAKTQDDKVRIGRQMLKVLNSPEGSDAVGVDEAKRLGDALEYNVFDVGAGLGVKTGKLHGRDLGGFEKQVEATLGAVRGSIDSNRSEVDRIMGRTSTPDGVGLKSESAHPMDSEAVTWAKANPNDPRSAQILKMNGQ